MMVRNRPDFASGLLFLVVGLAFASMARRYDMGTAKEIGPGRFPFALGTSLSVLGLVVAFRSISPVSASVPFKTWSWRPFCWICAAVLTFALALPRLGLLAAIGIMSVTALFASSEKRSRLETLLLVMVLMVFAYFVFVAGLRLQFPVLPVLS
jgi:hypothetical protein